MKNHRRSASTGSIRILCRVGSAIRYSSRWRVTRWMDFVLTLALLLKTRTTNAMLMPSHVLAKQVSMNGLGLFEIGARQPEAASKCVNLSVRWQWTVVHKRFGQIRSATSAERFA